MVLSTTNLFPDIIIDCRRVKDKENKIWVPPHVEHIAAQQKYLFPERVVLKKCQEKDKSSEEEQEIEGLKQHGLVRFGPYFSKLINY